MAPTAANRWPTTTAAAPPARSSPRTTVGTPRDLAVIGRRGDAGGLRPARPEPHLLTRSTRTWPTCAAAATYFTYWADAEARGARLRLVLGDARLTLDK